MTNVGEMHFLTLRSEFNHALAVHRYALTLNMETGE